VTLPQGVTVLLQPQPAGDVTRATQLPETACPAEHSGSGSLSTSGFATTWR